MLKAEFLLRLIDDRIENFQHMCFCLINGQVLVAVIGIQLLCAEMLGLEAQNSFITDCFFDRVFMQASSIQLVGSSRKIALGRIGIYIKTRCSRKAIPKGVYKELCQKALRSRCYGSVALVHDEGNTEIFDAVIRRSAFFQTLFHGNGQLLNCGNDNLLIIIFQLVDQIAYIVGFINVHHIVIRIGLECLCSLRIKVFTVDKEYRFFNARNVDQQISRSLIARHGLA